MKTPQEYGKEGAQKRWREKYDALKFLTAKYSFKEYKQHEFEKWPVKCLLVLVEWIKKGQKDE